MNSGDLTTRITLQWQTRTPNGQGGQTVTWADAATVWAKAWTASSGDQTQGGQTSLVRVQKFAIRFRSVLTSAWRIKWPTQSRTRYFTIKGVDQDDRNEFIFLTCEEAD